ncbi:MAG: GreA/GreB family elongation factor [Patescibacteria group bacterium]|nr:GreA/GreB family elongation factor [Patescibacteria group bacterium]
MQLPKRQSEVRRQASLPDDRHLTAEKADEMRKEIERLVHNVRPRLLEDLTRAREMGDLSENAAYSDAKRRVLGLDARVNELRERLRHAVIIRPGATADGRIRIGTTVILEINGRRRSYLITGTQETDPGAGRISHLSPLGSILIGRRVGESVTLKNAADQTMTYLIRELK